MKKISKLAGFLIAIALLFHALRHIASKMVPPLPKYRTADVIVVLGHPAKPNGSPSPAMAEEVDVAYHLYAAGYASKILFSGGAVRNEHVEANVMRDLAISVYGIHPEDTIVETAARDTLENVLNSASIMIARGWRSAIVVTTPFHAARVGKLFEKAGIIHVVVYHEDSYELRSLTAQLYAVIYEVFGNLWSYLSLRYDLRPFWSVGN